MSIHTIVASRQLPPIEPRPLIMLSSGLEGLDGLCEDGGRLLVPVEMGGLLFPKGFWVAEGVVLNFVLGMGGHCEEFYEH
jgi:hypothetical protein